MKVTLRIKRFPNGQVSCGNYTPHEKHLPEHRKAKGYITPDDVMEVENKEVAKEYVNGGYLEVVL